MHTKLIVVAGLMALGIMFSGTYAEAQTVTTTATLTTSSTCEPGALYVGTKGKKCAVDTSASIKKKPKITFISPTKLVSGDQVVIHGSGFAWGSTVRLTGKSTDVYAIPASISSDGKTITVGIVSEKSGTYKISVYNGKDESTKMSFKISPNPAVGCPVGSVYSSVTGMLCGNTTSVTDSSCLPGIIFSSITGRRCETTTPINTTELGCSPGIVFSSITGKLCEKTTTTTTTTVDAGCITGTIFSSTTGRQCETTTVTTTPTVTPVLPIRGCGPGIVFSALTGEQCK